MASTINASTSGGGGIVQTADSSGVLELQSGGVTKLTISSSGVAGNVTGTATALSTASGSAPSYSARAWVNFNGSGTVAIRAGGNVSSITDNGVGDYTVNFTTAMPDANYIGVHSGAPHNGRFYSNWNGTYNNATTAITNTTTTYRIVFADGGGVVTDSTNVYASFFR